MLKLGVGDIVLSCNVSSVAASLELTVGEREAKRFNENVEVGSTVVLQLEHIHTVDFLDRLNDTHRNERGKALSIGRALR